MDCQPCADMLAVPGNQRERRWRGHGFHKHCRKRPTPGNVLHEATMEPSSSIFAACWILHRQGDARSFACSESRHRPRPVRVDPQDRAKGEAYFHWIHHRGQDGICNAVSSQLCTFASFALADEETHQEEIELGPREVRRIAHWVWLWQFCGCTMAGRFAETIFPDIPKVLCHVVGAEYQHVHFVWIRVVFVPRKPRQSKDFGIGICPCVYQNGLCGHWGAPVFLQVPTKATPVGTRFSHPANNQPCCLLHMDGWGFPSAYKSHPAAVATCCCARAYFATVVACSPREPAT